MAEQLPVSIKMIQIIKKSRIVIRTKDKMLLLWLLVDINDYDKDRFWSWADDGE